MSAPSTFTYRASRSTQDAPTLLERYGETNVLALLRHYFPRVDPRTGSNMPNFDFGPIIEMAARTVEKIDMFDENEGLLDQVIFGLAHPDLCHPGVRDITQNREMIVLLLVRHFKKFGGLVLPPLPGARRLQDAYRKTVEADINAGREPAQMHYANWLQAQTISPPPGFGGRSTRGGTRVRGGQGGGNAGRSSSRGGRGGGI